MRRLWPVASLTLVLSCTASPDRPVNMGVAVRIPQITLDRLEPTFHLRIFAPEGRTCDDALGLIVRNGMPAYDFPGQNVRPFQRCDASQNWAANRAMFGGEASPVDDCFTAGMAHDVSVAGGTYLVLVEGTGTVTSADGTATRVTLGSGCASVMVNNGETHQVSIEMREQTPRGMCGDGEVTPDESCDASGLPTANCNAKCRYPERVVNSSMTAGHKRRPTVAWAQGQRLVVGFDGGAGDDVFVHLFDTEGAPITSQAALVNDHNIDRTNTVQQQGLHLFATSMGYVAGWASTEGDFQHYAPEGVNVATYDNPDVGLAMDVPVNPTTMGTATDLPTVAVAASDSRVVWVFEDAASHTLRVASTPLANPLTAPTADAPLVTSGNAMANALNPAIAPVANGFVVTWSAGAAGARDAYAMLLDASGTPMGSPVSVAMQTGGDQDQTVVAVNGSDVVIGWHDTSQTDADTDGATVRWRHFSATLTPAGNEVVAPTTTMGDQVHPAIAIARDGAVLLAWENVADGTIRGRLFHVDGSAIVNRIGLSSGDFVVNAAADEMPTFSGARHNPAAAFGGADRYAVAWEADEGGSTEIHMRILRE